MNADDRNVSGSNRNDVEPDDGLALPDQHADVLDSAPNTVPSRIEASTSTTDPATPPGSAAPPSQPEQHDDHATGSSVVTACSTTLAFMMRARLTGETRNRLSVPRSISSIVPIPAHMLADTAFITTTPGTR